jgi:hypothetical protein
MTGTRRTLKRGLVTTVSLREAAVMDRAELIELASPPCHDCGRPVQRVEMSYVYTMGDRDWVPGPTYAVCANRHRVLVEPAADTEEAA